MRWHIELLIELALLVILWRKSCPFWFGILIGTDFAANALQLLPYRAHFPQLSRLVWMSGITAAFPLGWLALVEAAEMPTGSQQFAHARILAFWVMAQLTCISFQTQGHVAAWNHVLLICDGLSFAAWIALFGF